jgi:hypothetical protein
MKTAFTLTVLALLTSIHAAVIQNDAHIVDQGAPPYFPFDRAFTVTSAGFLVIEVINSAPNEFTFQYRGIAELYSLFRITAGTDFTASFVNSQTAFVNNLNAPGLGVLTLAPGQSEYLAYWDQSPTRVSLIADDTDLYGWAQITNSGGELVVAASATADNGGIKVGTLQQIPEPGSNLLIAAGLASICIRRSRTRRDTATSISRPVLMLSSSCVDSTSTM